MVDERDPKVQLVFMEGGVFLKSWGYTWASSGSGSVEEVLYGFLLGLIEGRHALRPQTCRHLQRIRWEEEKKPHKCIK